MPGGNQGLLHFGGPFVMSGLAKRMLACKTTALVLTTLGLRRTLTANVDLYVRADGSDNNDGSANTPTGAFLTLQKAADVIATWDIRTYNVNVYVGAGTYTTGISISAPWLGSGNVKFIGDTTTPANVTISTSSGACVNLTRGTLQIEGFKFATSSGEGIVVGNGGSIRVTGNVEFGACGGGVAQIRATSGGLITMAANYRVSGGASYHAWAQGLGNIVGAGLTVTITTSVTFTYWSYANLGGFQNVFSNTYSGSASVTATRYLIETGGMIHTNGGGASYFPGGSAGSGGTTSGGGYYT